MVGWAMVTILVGPGGRQYVFGSLEWSTVSYLCFPYGVRIISCPGSVFFERSPLGPSYQTPVRSGGPGVAGGASPVYHHAPVNLGWGLGWTFRDVAAGCAAAGFAARIKMLPAVAMVAIAVTKRLLGTCLTSLFNAMAFDWPLDRRLDSCARSGTWLRLVHPYLFTGPDLHIAAAGHRGPAD